MPKPTKKTALPPAVTYRVGDVTVVEGQLPKGSPLARAVRDLLPPACVAHGPGWQCDRGANAALGLCSGHYMQERREKPYTPLRGKHGADPRGRVQVVIQVPTDDAEAMQNEAARLGVDVTEVYRAAVATRVKLLRKRADR